MNVRRASLDTHISQWLAQRQSTWLLCSELANAQKKAKPVTLKKITLFCQTLMDYVSLGHFNVYEKLTHAALKNNLPLDKQLLEDIGSTTDDVLHFNEKYTDPSHLETWIEDLSHLAERLAHRIEWEDRLMQPYLRS
jgi:regulator of sigma D